MTFRPTHRHHKGGLYELLSGSCRHTETGDQFVVYRNRDGEWWARPRLMFFEEVKSGVMRFAPLSEEEKAQIDSTQS